MITRRPLRIIAICNKQHVQCDSSSTMLHSGLRSLEGYQGRIRRGLARDRREFQYPPHNG